MAGHDHPQVGLELAANRFAQLALGRHQRQPAVGGLFASFSVGKCAAIVAAFTPRIACSSVARVAAGFGRGVLVRLAPGDAEATQWALGHNHVLSRRTGLYAAYSDISTKGGLSVAGVAQSLKPAFGDASYPGTGYQHGFQVGIKHAF